MNEIGNEKLLELINLGETETIEFKESFNDEAIETIGAFANNQGGVLLLGINDSGKVLGFNLGKKSIEDIANRIQEVTDPRLQPSISVIYFENKKIIMITVNARAGTPISVRGRYYRRVGKTNQRMSHDEILHKVILNAGASWDSVIEVRASIEDLDKSQIKEFIELVRKAGRRPLPNAITELELLRKLELIQNNKPTRAAVLLFGKNPQSYFPSAYLKIGRFRSLTHIVDDREAKGNLFQQLTEAMNWFRERLATEYIITGEPAREVLWEYPLPAIREAIINVLIHRDYIIQASSQIRLYDDHLSVRNLGGLTPPLTTDSLLTEHDSIKRCVFQ